MTGLNKVLLVFLGGGIGSSIRFSISQLLKSSASGFPYSTFVVNVSGCFLIGLLSSYLDPENQGWRLFILIGVLGGFTTFSSFGYETLRLFDNGQFQTGILYIFLSNLCGLSAVYLGNRIPGWLSL